MCGRKELLTLTFPGHDDREHARKRLCASLRATAEGGCAGDHRSTQRPFRCVIGRLDRWVFQPDHQIVKVLLDSVGQLATLPTPPLFRREAPQFLSHLRVDPLPTDAISLHLFERPAHLHKQSVQAAMETYSF